MKDDKNKHTEDKNSICLKCQFYNTLDKCCAIINDVDIEKTKQCDFYLISDKLVMY